MTKCFRLNDSVKEYTLDVIDCRGLPIPSIGSTRKPSDGWCSRISEDYHSLVAAVPDDRNYGYVSEPVMVPKLEIYGKSPSYRHSHRHYKHIAVTSYRREMGVKKAFVGVCGSESSVQNKDLDLGFSIGFKLGSSDGHNTILIGEQDDDLLPYAIDYAINGKTEDSWQTLTQDPKHLPVLFDNRRLYLESDVDLKKNLSETKYNFTITKVFGAISDTPALVLYKVTKKARGSMPLYFCEIPINKSTLVLTPDGVPLCLIEDSPFPSEGDVGGYVDMLLFAIDNVHSWGCAVKAEVRTEVEDSSGTTSFINLRDLQIQKSITNSAISVRF